MFDVAAYALLKRGVITAGGETPLVVSCVDARIENGQLVLVFSDGTERVAGAIPTIDDNTISDTTTWSSGKIVSYVDETVANAEFGVDEDAVAAISKTTTESLLAELMPSQILGSANTADLIIGGAADFDEADVLVGGDKVSVTFVSEGDA